jgi:uroporphyrinogen decarboxylase
MTKNLSMSNLPENTRLLKALKGEEVDRPPVWMMRQAGRYLPEYQVLRSKYTFFERCETPELVAEITTQPIDRLGVDAAILFSDILVIPQALDFDVTIEKGEGPRIHNNITSTEQVDNIVVADIEDRLSYVFEGIKATLERLDGKVPLIGFAGAPWTIFCYAVEGRGSKNFAKAKQFCFEHPEAAHKLLQKITDATIEYAKGQVNAGVHAFQLFDSWAGLWSPEGFAHWCMPYIKQILESITEVPTILFAKGCWYALKDMSLLSCSALGLDWTVSPEFARAETEGKITLQGNFDPTQLLMPAEQIKKEVNTMINRFGKDKYIVNLGHGILPNISVDHAQAFVDAVKEYGTK